jgi:ABC-type amino acid transport substrate-binding protein
VTKTASERRAGAVLLALAMVGTLVWTLAAGAAGLTETTLEKVARTGSLVIGTRFSSPPFTYVNRSNEWVGFSIDLVQEGVLPALSAKVGKPVKIETKESTPADRVTLLVLRQVDLIAETMTNAPQRRAEVEFSLTYFVTGGQFLVKKGSPIQGIQDIAGKRVAVLERSTYARIIREQVPKASLLQFLDHPDALRALVGGQADTYTSDGVQLHGLKRKLPDLSDYEVVGEPYTKEPYAMAIRKDDHAFKAVVDGGLRRLLQSGKYFEIYEKWFGPKGEVPYPMTPEVKASLLAQLKKQ